MIESSYTLLPLASCHQCGKTAYNVKDLQSFQKPTVCKSCYNIKRTWRRAYKALPHLVGVTISPKLSIVGKYCMINVYSKFKNNVCRTCKKPFTLGNSHLFTLKDTTKETSGSKIECDSCAISRLSKTQGQPTKITNIADRLLPATVEALPAVLAFQQSKSIFHNPTIKELL